MQPFRESDPKLRRRPGTEQTENNILLKRSDMKHCLWLLWQMIDDEGIEWLRHKHPGEYLICQINYERQQALRDLMG